MKRSLNAFAGLLLLTWAAPAATDITGKWTGFPVSMTFKQDGNKLTGTVGLSETEQTPIDDGLIDNDHITFKIGPMNADLRLKGDEISGDITDGTKTTRLVMKRRIVRGPSDPPLTFEAATVKRSEPAPIGKGNGSSMRAMPGRVTATNVTLKALIVRAWKLKNYQVTGPRWLSDERYDVVGTMAAGASTDDVLSMLQTLLKDRFRLVVHTEQKELSVYALLADTANFRLPPGKGLGSTSVNSGPKGRTLTADTTLTHLAEVLSDQVERPVIDLTEIKGNFHMVLEWTPDDNPSAPAAESAAGATIFTALHAAGLRLQGRKAPVEILVIDHAEKDPAEN